MNDTSMRGTRLGALSYETDDKVALAERQIVRYRCEEGHLSSVPFSLEAEDIPVTWECRCGREAKAVMQVAAMAQPVDRVERHVRTHWDMLLERRSIADLEELLDERLSLLRAQVPVPERKSA